MPSVTHGGFQLSRPTQNAERLECSEHGRLPSFYFRVPHAAYAQPLWPFPCRGLRVVWCPSPQGALLQSGRTSFGLLAGVRLWALCGSSCPRTSRRVSSADRYWATPPARFRPGMPLGVDLTPTIPRRAAIGTIRCPERRTDTFNRHNSVAGNLTIHSRDQADLDDLTIRRIRVPRATILAVSGP